MSPPPPPMASMRPAKNINGQTIRKVSNVMFMGFSFWVILLVLSALGISKSRFTDEMFCTKINVCLRFEAMGGYCDEYDERTGI